MMKTVPSGVYSTKDLEKYFENRMAIKRACESGDLIKVTRGYYSTPDLTEPKNTTIMISKYCDGAVISNLSILSHYGLISDYVDQVHLDVPINSTYHASNELLVLHRSRKMDGATTISINGVKLRGYNIHRAVFEVLLIESGFGAKTREVLNSYVKSGNCDLRSIAEYSEIFGARGREILKVLKVIISGQDIY